MIDAIHVLLIEDDPDQAHLLRRLLSGSSSARFEVRWAAQLVDAMDLLDGGGIDAILLDLTLPDSKGIDTLTRVRGRSAQAAIVVLTGLEDESLGVEAVRRGADDYLIKSGLDGRCLARAVLYTVERKRAERAVRESEARKAAIFESSPDALITMDRDGRVVEFNHAAEATFGYRRDEVIGGELARLIIPPWTRERFERGMERYRESGQSIVLNRRIEMTAMRADGTEFPAEIVVIKIDEGEAPLFSGHVRDISERERTDGELIEQAFLGAMGVKVGVALVRGDSIRENLESCIEVLVRYLDLTLGRIWVVETHAQTLELQACRGLDAAQFQVETSLPFGRCRVDLGGPAHQDRAVDDDAERWIREEVGGEIVTIALIIEGRLVGLLELFSRRAFSQAALHALAPVADGIAQCIERKRAEDRLRASEARLRFLMDQMPGILWTTDTDLRFTSSAGTDLANIRQTTRAEIGRETLFDYFRTDDPSFLPIDAHLRALRGESVSYELEWAERIFQSHVEPLHGRDGRVVGCIGVALDITPLKQAETALRRSEEEMRIAGEIQRVFYPKETPAPPGFDIAAATKPVQAAGGDYFDYLPMPDGCIGLTIGDVSGHGIGPAILMASTRAYLRVFAASLSDVGMILVRLNQALLPDVGDERFVTMILARLDPATRTLVYTNAGHPTGYVLDRSGRIKALLKGTAVPLGIAREEGFSPIAAPLVLEPGDLLLLLTDGVEDALGHDDQRFGIDRTLRVVRENHHESAQAIVNALLDAIRDFTEGGVQIDDITAIVVKYEPDRP